MADHIATAADYADALMITRRAKNLFVWLLLLVLLIQITIFFTARYTDLVVTPSAGATTQPAMGEQLLAYLVGISAFFGVALSAVLALVLLLIANIMLVGRLIGVARLTSAYIWTLVLIVLLFPWQAYLDPFFFKLPGALYTWEELTAQAHFPGGLTHETYLKWGKFAVLPLLALIILLVVQIKSVRGLRQAMGEAEAYAPSPPIA